VVNLLRRNMIRTTGFSALQIILKKLPVQPQLEMFKKVLTSFVHPEYERRHLANKLKEDQILNCTRAGSVEDLRIEYLKQYLHLQLSENRTFPCIQNPHHWYKHNSSQLWVEWLRRPKL
jgi:hypothetical protein